MAIIVLQNANILEEGMVNSLNVLSAQKRSTNHCQKLNILKAKNFFAVNLVKLFGEILSLLDPNMQIGRMAEQLIEVS
ncbi:MAG TPA: hypothetical protein P5274_01565 [Candidatus Paceibacterota bacterium]|nr:hypothetical protein [Candidatus Paceibacterota bacterium]